MNMPAPESYTVGWICALPTEFTAAQLMLDEKHKRPRYVSPQDTNSYALGKIEDHNVVIAVLPNGEYGMASAAGVAVNMLSSFPNVRIGLMVGIGGGAPTATRDIRLGDVVVSAPGNGTGGILQYDFGRAVQEQDFQMTGYLNQPPTLLRTATNSMQSEYEINPHRIQETIDQLLVRHPGLYQKYGRPDQTKDRLYRSDVLHPFEDKQGCDITCGDGSPESPKVVWRRERGPYESNPAIHYCIIASANQVMRDAILRDRLAADRGVLCFEMEAAGLMNQFPCVVIRGICDYSDTHKNKEWQSYAAIAAASYAKDLLSMIVPTRVEAERKISEAISEGTPILELPVS